MNNVLVYILITAAICCFVFIGIFDLVYYNYCVRKDFLDIGLQAESKEYQELQKLEKIDNARSDWMIRHVH